MAQIDALSTRIVSPVFFPPVSRPSLIPTPAPRVFAPRVLAGLEVAGARPELENLFTGAEVERDTLGLMGPVQSVFPAPVVLRPLVMQPEAAAAPADATGQAAPRAAGPSAASAQGMAAIPGTGGAAAGSLLQTVEEILALAELGPPSLASFPLATDAYLMEIQAQEEMEAARGPAAARREWFG